MGDKKANSGQLGQMQQFADFIIQAMDERFAEQDKRIDKRFAEQEEKFDRKLGILAEDVNDKLARVVENIDSRIEHHLKPVKQDVEELKSDMKVVKAAVTANSNQLSDHESRLTHLEAKAA